MWCRKCGQFDHTLCYIHLWPMEGRRGLKIEFENVYQTRAFISKYASLINNKLVIKLPVNIYVLIQRIRVDYSALKRIC